MLSPLRINADFNPLNQWSQQQTKYVPTLPSSFQLNQTYEYPTKKYFFTTPSTEYKHQRQLQNNFNSFQFSVFDISSQFKNKSFQKSQVKQDSLHISQIQTKPEPFMGAFIQTQKQFDCFNLNVKIPSLKQVLPFSRILSSSICSPIQRSIPRKQQISGKKEDCSEILQSRIYEVIDPLNSSVSIIEPANQLLQSRDSISFSRFLENYNQKQQEERHRKLVQSQMWQGETESRYNHAYQFHSSKCSQFIEKVESSIVLTQSCVKYDEPGITSSIIKMILGVQSELFLLDYHSLEWRYNESPVKFQYTLRTSFQKHLEDILFISSLKAKLETALNCIKKQSYRRILQEVALEIKDFLSIIEEIALEVGARKGSILDLVLTLSQFKSEMVLVHELLLNDSYIKAQGKSYMDFDVSYLNSEAVIFRQIVRISSTNDTLMGKGYELCLKLLRAAFKPITFTLNRIVFQEIVEISNRDDTYLRFYFENLKDLLSYLGKRIDLIKNESNEIYMICRMKQDIKIVMETSQLERYTEEWNFMFYMKKRSIEEIQKREKKRIKEEKQKKEEDKIKEIYQLRAKLLKRIEETKQRKSEKYLEGMREIDELKKDIAAREERRRLNHLIQKQQQKGFLLEAELKEKRKLIQQKQELLAKAEKEGIQLIAKIIENKKPIEAEQQSESKEEKQQDILDNGNKIKKDEVQLGSKQKMQASSEIKIEEKREQIPAIISNMQKTSSNLSNISIPKEEVFESESDKQQEQQVSINIEQMRQGEGEEDSVEQKQQRDIHVSTNTVLQLCIDNIIKQQIEITNLGLSYLVYDKYQLLNIMEFMRKIFLNGNGKANTNFLHISVSHDSKINIQYFNECSLFDFADEFIRSLGPQFYQVHSQPVARSEHEILRRGAGIYQNRQINLFQESIEVSIGFQFSKLPVILEPYFSYIHLSKYMQIFSHILKIIHCNNLVAACMLSLNQFQLNADCDRLDKQFLKKLCLTRHVIHIYLNTLQSYLFHRVIEKQLKVLRTKLKIKDINQLAVVHLNALDFIIRKGLIENPLNDVSKKIKGLFLEIRKFKNIVDSFCANDIHSYVRREIQTQVNNLHRVFREEQSSLESLFYHP